MELMKADVIDAIVKVISPRSILFKNDSSIRELEGIERYIEVGMGEVPDRVQLREAGVTFEVALAEGQKNRLVLRPSI
jgi:23S rRNA (cytosine1962-C5)-methyltransferase